MLFGFSPIARRAMERAHEEATSRGHDALGAGHLLVGIAETPGSGAEVLAVLGVDPVELVAVSRGRAPIAGPPSDGPLPFGGAAREMLGYVSTVMTSTGHRCVYSAHLLLALFLAGGEARELFGLFGVDEDSLRHAMVDVLATSSEVAGRGGG